MFRVHVAALRVDKLLTRRRYLNDISHNEEHSQQEKSCTANWCQQIAEAAYIFAATAIETVTASWSLDTTAASVRSIHVSVSFFTYYMRYRYRHENMCPSLLTVFACAKLNVFCGNIIWMSALSLLRASERSSRFGRRKRGTLAQIITLDRIVCSHWTHTHSDVYYATPYLLYIIPGQLPNVERNKRQ
jgi:hypothetical protein